MNAVAPSTQDSSDVHDVVIIGAGFAGLGMAIRLRQAGIRNFVILERSAGVGGTWRDNQYPGAACDVPSNLYSYSFAPNPRWSRGYSSSREILAYIHSLVQDFKLQGWIRFEQDVTDMAFDRQRGAWRIATAAGALFVARSVVLAYGPMSNCSLPKLAGLDAYQGRVMHSARWDHSYDMRGKRVAVIGTGSSAVQIIPELVKHVSHLTVFQRTAGWVLPRMELRSPPWRQALFKRFPIAQKLTRHALYAIHEAMAMALVWRSPLGSVLQRIALWHLHSQVKDRRLRRQLTPTFRIGCKRLLMSSDYYRALQKPNCELVTEPIVQMTERGIRSAAGLEHTLDCIVFATGFDVSKAGTPFPIKGSDGRDLQQEWSHGARAYKSVSVAGYPNLFFTFGPNSGPGSNSALVHLESQLNYAVQGIRRILTENLLLLDVDHEAQARHNRMIQQRMAKTNWSTGCTSWYLMENGFNSIMYPGFSTQYALQMRHFRDRDYHRISA